MSRRLEAARAAFHARLDEVDAALDRPLTLDDLHAIAQDALADDYHDLMPQMREWLEKHHPHLLQRIASR
jgi:hypothetical protein